jgi:APA family basic amino acid/polyamine antiporter
LSQDRAFEAVKTSSGTAPALGLWSATALVVGHTIAVGIFLTPAEVIGAVASPALTLGLWVLCGVLVLAGAFTFGELASRYPRAGGPYIYLREAWGERLAFLYGWQSLLIMDPGVTAALAAGLAEYALVLWPATRGAERWLAIGVIWVLAALSMAGLSLSARVLATMTAVKVVAFAAVVIVALGAGSGSWSHYQPFVDRHDTAVPLSEAIALGLVSVFFSFGGFWEASRISGEVRNAPRTMPVALALGVACVTLVYVAMTIAFIYLVPAQQATSASEFAHRAGEAMLGEAGPSVLAMIVVLSVLASALALLIMAPRLYVAMSDDGLFPSALATVNAATRSSVRATALLALLASVFVSVATFQQIVAFFMCTTLGFIALAAAALVVVRRRAPEETAFRAPGYPVSAVLFVTLVLAVVALVAINRPLQALAGFGIVLLGVPAHRLFARRHTERRF